MVTSSNGNIFCVTGPLWGESTGHRWIPLTKVSDAELWCFPLSAPEKRLDKQKRCRWFETPSRSLWRHCNGTSIFFVRLFWAENTTTLNPLLFFLHRGTIMRKGTSQIINILRPRQNGRLWADNILRAIFLFENVCMMFIFPNGAIQIVIQIMAWRRAGDKTLSEPMVV